MKLSEPFTFQATESGGFHARVLRAIGQDLTELYPEKFEIERQGEDLSCAAPARAADSKLKLRNRDENLSKKSSHMILPHGHRSPNPTLRRLPAPTTPRTSPASMR